MHDKVDKTPKVVKFKADDVNKMLGITISTSDMEVELDRLDFAYELDGDEFTVKVPNRRLDIDPNVNDIAEEIGRLYGYHNLVSTLPKVPLRRGEYVGDVKYRKLASKRLRSLGLNECKTYTLVSPEMASSFKYDDMENVVLPNPMSYDKSVIRTTIMPSLLNTYEYNKARRISDVNIYEISKVYDKDYNEVIKLAILMKGNLYSNNWQGTGIKVDFYVIKGVIENILDYFGLKNRYTIEASNVEGMHPYMCANIILDREVIGVIGRVHPNINKDDIYMAEISLSKFIDKKIKDIKYRESSKYPEIKKDMAFVVKKDVSSATFVDIIKRSGGKLLTNIEVFDVYTGTNVGSDEKSIAYSLTFNDPTKTLTDEEVTQVFNKIISDVESKLEAKLRDN